MEAATLPQRARRADGTWGAIDLALQRGEAGLRPALSAADVTFSAGGAGPLVEMAEGGRELTLSWPDTLPAPSVSGDSATYAEVLPGVDLVLRATLTGFTTVFVVKTSEAAADSRIRSVELLAGGDAALSRLADGALTASAGGQVVATAPAPVMWDSSLAVVWPDGSDSVSSGGVVGEPVPVEGAAPSTVRRAGDGAKVRDVGTEVTAGGDLVLVPDAVTLSAPDTVYPVYVDPSFSNTSAKWAYANSINSNWDVEGQAWVGRNPYDGTLYRSFFDFNVSTLKGKQVTASSVTVKLDHSWSCDPTWTHMYRTGAITVASGARMSWGTYSLPSEGTWLDSAASNANETGGCGSVQPNVDVVFSSSTMTADVQYAASHNWSTYTVGLCACNDSGQYESNQDRWKRWFVGYTVLRATYNSYPTVGTRSTVPSTSCVTGSTRPFINTTTPQLKAQINDAEGSSVKAEFEWWAVGGTAKIGSLVTGTAASGSTLSATVPSGAFSNGGNYMWRVRGNDGAVNGSWSSYCEFTVDTVAPSSLTVSGASHPVETSWYPNSSFSATMGATEAGGIAGYAVKFDTSSTTSAGTTVTQTSATASATGQADGSHWLHFAVKDKAGNWSGTKHFRFNVDVTKPGAPGGMASSTHPVSTNVYSSRTVIVSWNAPTDTSGIATYAIKVNQTSTTLPATTDSPQSGTDRDYTTTVASDGTWWVHVRAKDNAGNWSDSAAHFKFNVDTSLPEITSSTHPDQSVAYPSGAFSATWTAVSGALGFSVVVDNSSGTTPDTTVDQSTSDYSTTKPDGEWYLHVRAKDSAGNWGGAAHFRFVIDTTAPAAPAVDSTDYPAGAWSGAVDQLGLFTAGAAGSADVVEYRYGLDSPPTIAIEAPDAGADVEIEITPTTDGPHTLNVVSLDAAGNQSPTTGYAFSVGDAAGQVLMPKTGDISGVRFALQAAGHASTSGVTFQWRRGDADGWTDVPAGDVTLAAGGGAVTWPLATTGAGAYPKLTWNIENTLNQAEAGDEALDGPLQLRAVFTGTGFGPSAVAKVTLDRNRASAASADVGAGSVNLLTGNLGLAQTDVNAFGMALSRSYNTRQAGDVDVMFGPGWVSSVAASADPGYTSLTVVGSLVQIGLPDGATLGFALESGDGTSASYEPQIGAEGYQLIWTASPDRFTLTDPSGNTVWFTRPSGGATGVYTPTAAVPVGSSETTTVSWELVPGSTTQARPTRVLAPVPAGVSCTSSLVAGCKALTFTYATATTATSTDPGGWGDYADRVSTVEFTVWDPDAGPAAMRTVEVARYSYDVTGKLRTAWDPRLDWLDTSDNPPITRHVQGFYDYDSNSVLTSLTPSGQLAWQFAYTTVPGDSGAGRLATVTRSALSAGTAVSTVVYRVPVSGSGAPYDLSAGQTARWGQVEAPTHAAAVFPPTQVPTLDQPAGVYPSSYEYAIVSYLDANGREINTAAPGGGVDTTWFDLYGNVTQTLTPANRDRALAASASDTPAEEATEAAELSTVHEYSPDGQRLLSTLGPEHDVALPDGSLVRGRSHTVNTYDEGAPASETPYNLVTTTVESVRYEGAGGSAVDADQRTSTTAYDWDVRSPTVETVDPAGLALTTRTGYDSEGRVISTTAPAGGTTTDTPSTRITVYYTAAANATYPGCGGKPEWDGLVCRTQPGGQPSSGPELPYTVTTYGMYGQVRESIESMSTGELRRTTITYDLAGRAETTEIVAAAGLGTAVPKTRTVYDNQTGQAVKTQSLDSGGAVTAEIVRGYDALGRLTSYTDADGNMSTTSYDIASRISTSFDGKATRTYTYDGGSERRSLPTQVVDSGAGTFTAAYDAEGNPTSQTWPNGVEVTTTINEEGAPVGITYTQTGCGQPDCTLYSESVVESDDGQVRQHISTLSDQSYTYDGADRLTAVADTVNGDCTTRTYGYDTASNRTALDTYAPDADGACQTSTINATSTWGYDAGDRMATTGTVYDALGRTAIVPPADTTNPAGGDLTIDYYQTDLVETITQGTRSTDYTPDVAGDRIRSWTDNITGSPVTGIHHYAGDGDSPAWTQEDPTQYTRIVAGLAGMAGICASESAATDWQITNLHGDIVATIHGTDAGLTATSEATEYGGMRDPDDTGTLRYGWLGTHQRTADAPTGIVLMGVRLYNTATGRFLQVDPVYGASANRYDYVNQDPINSTDLDGKGPCRLRNPYGGSTNATIKCYQDLELYHLKRKCRAGNRHACKKVYAITHDEFWKYAGRAAGRCSKGMLGTAFAQGWALKGLGFLLTKSGWWGLLGGCIGGALLL